MPDAIVAPDTWRIVVGGEPENTVNQRGVGLVQHTGPFAEAVAALTMLPGRVDWLFSAIATGGPDDRVLGDFPAASEPFRTAISRWAASEHFPAVNRLALGIGLSEPTESRETGHARLRDFISVVPEGQTTDFLYQVNRPRPGSAGVPNLSVNRLAKWSVPQVQLLTLSSAAAPILAAPRTLVNLELDVNTSGDFTRRIPPDSLGAVLDDLWAGVAEIAANGALYLKVATGSVAETHRHVLTVTSSTQPFALSMVGTSLTEPDVKIQAQLDSILERVRHEIVEDGMTNTVTTRLPELVANHYRSVLPLIAALADGRRTSAAVTAELLKEVGRLRDARSHSDRRWLLLHALSSSNPAARDGAGVGLAWLKDPSVATSVRDAAERESIPQLKVDLEEVFRLLTVPN